MKRAVLPLLILTVLAACAATPKAQMVQQASTVEAVNDLLVTAVSYGVITPDEARAGQKLTRLAATNIRAAAVALKAGKPMTEVDRLMGLARDYLIQANTIATGGA